MKQVRPVDLIRDIEFEILLGTISRENFGEAIQTLKVTQNRLREEVIGLIREPQVREAFMKVFQVNEMMFALFQEMGMAIHSVRATLPAIVKWTDTAGTVIDAESHRSVSGNDNWPQSCIPAIEALVTSDSLQLDVDVRPTRVPLVGKLLHRVRIALHHLVLFYVNRLGARQERINEAYRLQIQEFVSLLNYQQEQINILSQQLKEVLSRQESSGETV